MYAYQNTSKSSTICKMESWLWIIISLLFSFLITIFPKKKVTSLDWPPGPRKLPILGNLHQLIQGGDLPYIKLAKLAQDHGPMFTIWFGSWKPAIVVNNLDLVWEVLVTKSSDFSSRDTSYTSGTLTAAWQTLASCEMGSYWYKLRNGLHSNALNPHNLLEKTPYQEQDVLEMLGILDAEASSSNGVVKPLTHFRRNTIKLVARFCFGSHFKDESNFVDGIATAIESLTIQSKEVVLVQIFDFLHFTPFFNRPFKKLDKFRHHIENLLSPCIASSKFSKDCYLQFLQSQNLREEVITFILFEIFLLAVDSISSTTAWAMSFLIHNQAVQQRVYEEIREEFGDGDVQISRVKRLDYLQAVVKEAMRMKPIAPLAITHKADKDSSLMGRKIMAGTPVMVNLHAVQHDPSVWVEPYMFNPERFMDSSIMSDEMERSFLPFGAGRRMCAGMDLAKLQVAFTLASLVKKFQWSSAVENQLPDLSEDYTFVLMMKTTLEARITTRS